MEWRYKNLLLQPRSTIIFLPNLIFFLVTFAWPVSSGSTKHSIVLTSDHDLNINVTKGDSLVLICGHPSEWLEDGRITWYKNGQPIQQRNHPHIIVSNLNLHFQKTNNKDAGEYACVVEDKVGDEWKEVANRSGIVTVMPRPSRKSDKYEELLPEFDESDFDGPDDIEVTVEAEDRLKSCEVLEESLNLTTSKEPFLCFDLKKKMTHYIAKPAGSTVTIYCTARGNPKPTMKWFKDDAPFNAFGYQHKIIKQGIQIQDSSLKDSGKYRCEASNDNGTITYETDYYVVQRALTEPIFLEVPTNMTQVVGSTIELRVQIYSDPEYSLSWIKQTGDDPHNVTRVESRVSDEELRMDPHVLILENATLSDEGWYSCVAGNSIGRSHKSAYVRILTVAEARESEMRHQVKVQRTTPQQIALYITTAIATVIGVVSLLGFCFWNRVKLQQWRYGSDAKAPTHWIKQITIDRRPIEDNDERAMMIPEVNIKSVESNKSNQEYELPVDLSWEFPRERLELGKHLGEGAFGEVKFGIADGIIESGVKTTVAVKSLKRTHSDTEMIDLISEMETMKELGKHKNIINLLGCCTQGGELLVIMEFAENGNLRDFLRDNRHNFLYQKTRQYMSTSEVSTDMTESGSANSHMLTFTDLMSMAYQVARGMDYLAQKKYVHRDLAARNVLVSAGNIVKIADFGMTRSTFANDYYRKKSDGRVPVKWMAPETLFHRIYTTQSDVWSYGILLWEIVTLGGTPYPSMPDVNKLLDFLKSGHRMEQPANCPTELYLIMRDCWMESPSSRPSFGDLVADVGRILSIASGTEYMDMEGVRPMDCTIIETPPSSPENSAMGIAMFDPEFLQSFMES